MLEISYEGVVGAYFACVASQHTDYPSLACFKLRDSCITTEAIHGVFIFLHIRPRCGKLLCLGLSLLLLQRRDLYHEICKKPKCNAKNVFTALT